MEYKIYISRHSRDAVAAVHRYLISVPSDETVRVYAVGGDGILFDCLNGMVDFPNAELTSVPYGSANDFVRAFGEDAKMAFRDIKKLSFAPSRPMDIIRCGASYALLAVNIGLVGKTVINANEILRHGGKDWIRSHTSKIYSLCGARTIMDKEILHQHYTIFVDGKDMSGNYCNIHIANTACDGGEFVPSPYSIPDDGELEAIFMRSRSRLDTLKIIGDRNNGRFGKHKFFESCKCKTMEIYSDTPLCAQMDGESFYARELKIEIVPNGVKIFAPEEMKFTDYSYRAYSKESKVKN